MKTKTVRSIIGITVVVMVVGFAGSAWAQTTYVRQNNATLLNTTGAWSPAGTPGPGDIAAWTASTANRTTALGGSVTWGKILMNATDPGGDVTIGNTAGATLTLNGLNGVGIDLAIASRSLTISDPVALGASQTWTINSGRTLAVGYPIGETSAGLVLTKTSAGQLTLNPATANTFTGGLTINGGTVLADFTNMGTTTDLIASSCPLTLGGGTLIVQGKASSVTAQTFNGLTLNQGYSYLTNNLNTATSVTTTLGGITRNFGGTVGFGGTGTITTSQANINNILGPWAFFGIGNASKYAVGSGTIAGLTQTGVAATGVTDATGTVNYDVTGAGTMGAGANFNTLRYTGAAGTLAGAFMANGLMNVNGALVMSGALTIGSTRELVVNPAGAAVTLSGLISDNGNGPSALTTGGGTATVTLSGTTNTFSGPITVGAGTLSFAVIANGGSPSSLGQSSASATNLVLGNNAALTYTGPTASSDRSFTLNGSASLNGSGTGALSLTNTAPIAFGVTNQAVTLNLGGSSAVFTNILSATITDNGSGPVSLYHGATGNHWWLTSSNSFSGGLSFNRGFIIFSSGALGTSGKIVIGSNTLPPFGLRWAPGCSDDISSRFNDTGTSGYCTLDTGTNDVVFASAIAMRADSWLIKEGSGSLTLMTASGWGGGPGAATLINGGTLGAKVLVNGGVNSSIGNIPNTAAALGLRGNGATLKYVGTGSTNDHNFHLSGTNTIDASGTGALLFTQTGAISPTPVSRVFTLTSGSKNTGNAPSSSSDLVPGMLVGGTGITAGTKIVSINLNGQLTFDQNATVSGASTLSFGSYLPGILTLTGSNTSTNEIRGILKDSVSGIDASVVPLSVTKAGVGRWVLSGTNIYTGTTTISDGTLALGANNALPDASQVVMSGGILDVGTYTDTLGVLDVTGTATINIGSGGTLAFANSSTQSWSGGTVNITGNFVAGSSIRFGTSSSALTADQKKKITFNGKTMALNESGFVVIPQGLIIQIR